MSVDIDLRDHISGRDEISGSEHDGDYTASSSGLEVESSDEEDSKTINHDDAYMATFINDHGQGTSLLLKIRLKSKDLLCTFAQQSVAPCLHLLSLNPR